MIDKPQVDFRKGDIEKLKSGENPIVCFHAIQESNPVVIS
jgi:hypothetical protein